MRRVSRNCAPQSCNLKYNSITRSPYPPNRLCCAQVHSLRGYSSSLDSIRNELLSRPPHVIQDYLFPTPSHLLSVSLQDLFPCPPEDDSWHKTADLASYGIPQGHHLVYFPAQVPAPQLLPDGTDKLHYPGAPFTRRMWAGGSMTFNTALPLLCFERPIQCLEVVSDVTIRGPQGKEKIFVHLDRCIDSRHRLGGRFGSLEELRELTSQTDEERMAAQPAHLRLIEKRSLVFMRGRSAEEILDEAANTPKIIKPTHNPDHSITIAVDPSLLFRFSALTFNAHRIHLDAIYARNVEGHRNLVVHGPFTVVLLLSFLRGHLPEGIVIQNFTYRNLAPLYADEPMRVCIRRDNVTPGKYDTWIEGREGGYAVRGSVTTGPGK